MSKMSCVKLLGLMLVGSVVIFSGATVAAAYGLAAPAQGSSEQEKPMEKPVLLAQLYDPGEEIYQDNMVRVYIDPMGRRITMDQHGKILQVEEQAVGAYGGRGSGLRQDPWGAKPSSSGREAYGGYADVPDNPGVDYYPAPPSSGQSGFGRDHAIDRAELPPPTSGGNNAALGGNDSFNNDWGSAEPLQPEYGNSQSGLPGPQDMTPAVEMPKGQGAKTKLASYQILMSRAGTSPGVIDGRAGSNVEKAAASYREIAGEVLDPNNVDHINALLEASGGPAFTQYQITNEDIGRFYLASVPSDYAEKAKLEEMAYVSPREMLAERFHVDENYLQELNPGSTFRHPGEVITVPNIVRKKRSNVARIIADKGRKQVRGYDEAGNLVVAYPSTIGSSDNPSPSGIVTVERIATNPNYTYNPKINFKQGNNDKVLTIPPGPNGPVGTVWIALSKPTYGIHGTPDPSRIGKTSSHGCVRLTNWDAEELVKLVKPGVVVEFID